MFRTLIIALALATGSFAALSAAAQGTSPGIQAGTLTCIVEGESNFIIGSTAILGCSFRPAIGDTVEYYTGTVRDFGLDIGTTNEATMVWAVLAPSADMDPGALSGEYGGVTAGASLGAGLKANALIGGLDKSIALNPFSIESQTGTNLTLGISRLTLKPIN
ncbi:MAG: DUF992 domain-containing protein [Roseibium sp.]|nr:DUF992 domain-containing protein [Roseibium sp.]